MSTRNADRRLGAWVVGNVIAVAGLAAVLPLMIVAFVPGAAATPLLALVPELPAGGPAPLLLALGGIAAMSIGNAILTRRSRLLEAERLRREDGHRRLHAYRGDERIEPTFGPEST